MRRMPTFGRIDPGELAADHSTMGQRERRKTRGHVVTSATQPAMGPPPHGVEEILASVASALTRGEHRRLGALLDSLATRVAPSVATDLRAIVVVAHYDIVAARNMWATLLPRLR
jgi:hypothetical protein